MFSCRLFTDDIELFIACNQFQPEIQKLNQNNGDGFFQKKEKKSSYRHLGDTEHVVAGHVEAFLVDQNILLEI